MAWVCPAYSPCRACECKNAARMVAEWICGWEQDYINIELDSNRNQLIRVHTSACQPPLVPCTAVSKRQLRCFPVFWNGQR